MVIVLISLLDSGIAFLQFECAAAGLLLSAVAKALRVA